MRVLCLALLVALVGYPSLRADEKPAKLSVSKSDRIVLIGAGMGARMAHHGFFETEVFLRFPKSQLSIRNLCDDGNTPGFRPHPGRGPEEQFAFPGAKELVPAGFQVDSKPQGFFESPDAWLTRLGADVIVAFFGFNSSFEGASGVERFKKELSGFVEHTLGQRYNGKSAPKLALVSPTAVQDLSARQGTPDGIAQNANLGLYVAAMREVAAQHGVLFVDAFTESRSWYDDGEVYAVDGALLNERGYRRLAPFLADAVFKTSAPLEERRDAVHAAVKEKNRLWLADYKIPNGVHVFGRRHKPFGHLNYPAELKKIREMTALRDRGIELALQGQAYFLDDEDASTFELPIPKTNLKDYQDGTKPKFLSPAVAMEGMTLPTGYQISVFASEEQFPDLGNPVQLTFDNKGRLWVATMESYPHFLPGGPRPNDKLHILEDTDGDGLADRKVVFADGLHIPYGFEISHDGVYVAQSGSLIRLRDSDGDDKADERELILTGFDDHDTHHGISAFCADPSGAFVMCEGIFLHSNIETVYGPQRGTNGGFFRYSPQRKELSRHAQFTIPNPWGVVYDAFGQDFFLHTSAPSVSWMTPGTVRPVYGRNMKAPTILTSHGVRPTSGFEIVSSRHFPDEVQGDFILGNLIGFHGIKQHQVLEDGTGYTSKYRHDLLVSKDPHFRPADLEFGPEGALYVLDWHNPVLNHGHASARDPLLDHKHGRIYRVTYPARPLVTPAKIAGASLAELLENLRLPEARTRYRTRRELRGRDVEEVAVAAAKWARAISPTESSDRLKLEALWVTWGADRVDEMLLRELLASKDHRVRAAAVRVLRHNSHRIPGQRELLQIAAEDEHGRVRLEAVAAASWLDRAVGLEIVGKAEAKGVDGYSRTSIEFAKGSLNQVAGGQVEKVMPPAHLAKEAIPRYVQGHEIYARDAHCGTCHGPDGNGLQTAGFPPLAKTSWVTGDPDRLIKLTLKGLHGKITVNGREYAGAVAMPAFEYRLSDHEMAAVLTYVRNSFGNESSPIFSDQVKAVREQESERKLPFRGDELQD